MKFKQYTMVAALLLLFAGQPVALGQAAPSVSEVWEKFDSLQEAQKYSEAISVLEANAEKDHFSTEDRARFYGWAALTCTQMDQDTCSSNYTQKAIDVDPIAGRFMATQLQGMGEDELVPTESFLWLLKNAPDTLEWIEVRTVRGFLNELIKINRSADARAMLEALLAQGYEGSSDGVTPEGLWIDLGRLQIADGDADKATQLLTSNMMHTSLSTNIWQNRDYAPVWEALEAKAQFDSKTMLNEQLEKALSEAERAKSLGWDAWIGHRLDLVMTLRTMGDLSAAEQLANETLAVIPEHQMSVTSVGWLKNELAYIYQDQGAPEKALDYMSTMLSVPVEEKKSLIGHLINLSVMLWQNGRYEEAVSVADDALVNYPNYTSNYGMVWAEAGKLCAQTSMGRHYDAVNRWHELKKTPDVNYAAIEMMALCMDDLDFAAKLYIERLGKPTERAGALTALSQYKWVGPKNGEYRLRERLKVVAEREDVQAAVAKVGRLGAWPFPRNYWGEY